MEEQKDFPSERPGTAVLEVLNVNDKLSDRQEAFMPKMRRRKKIQENWTGRKTAILNTEEWLT